MSPQELIDTVRRAIATLAPIGQLGGGLSLHAATTETMDAALAFPASRFIRYTGDGGPRDRGYVRLDVDGVVVAIHNVEDTRAAARFPTPPEPVRRRPFTERK